METFARYPICPNEGYYGYEQAQLLAKELRVRAISASDSDYGIHIQIHYGIDYYDVEKLTNDKLVWFVESERPAEIIDNSE